MWGGPGSIRGSMCEEHLWRFRRNEIRWQVSVSCLWVVPGLAYHRHRDLWWLGRCIDSYCQEYEQFQHRSCISPARPTFFQAYICPMDGIYMVYECVRCVVCARLWVMDLYWCPKGKWKYFHAWSFLWIKEFAGKNSKCCRPLYT